MKTEQMTEFEFLEAVDFLKSYGSKAAKMVRRLEKRIEEHVEVIEYLEEKRRIRRDQYGD